MLILNCGDGLELATELADVRVPQMVVMREAVQDQVAQEFVKLLLKACSGGKSLQLSVREARERLQAIEKVVPAASWLPVVYQQPAQPPSSWQQLAQIAASTPKMPSMFQSVGWKQTPLQDWLSPIIANAPHQH